MSKKSPEGMQNEKRNRLFALITMHPGISVREAARQLNVSTGVLAYHMEYLELHGQVFCAKFQNRRLLFPYPAPKGIELASIALLRDPFLHQVHQYVRQHGPINQKAVLSAFEWPRATVQHRLDRLVSGKIIGAKWLGRSMMYEVAA